MRFTSLLAILLLLGATGGSAQPAERTAETCSAIARPWEAARTADAAKDGSGLGVAGIGVEEPVRLRLHPDGEIAYLSLPQGEGEAASFGGLARFEIERAGRYRVGVSDPAWVDVVALEEGAPAEAKVFGPGPPCSGIRKAVAFDLAAGRYALEISGVEQADLGVVVTPLVD